MDSQAASATILSNCLNGEDATITLGHSQQRLIVSLFVLKARPEKTFYTGSYCARIIKGPTKTVALAQSHQTALKKPTVHSPRVETRQRRDLLRAKSIKVFSVLAYRRPNRTKVYIKTETLAFD